MRPPLFVCWEQQCGRDTQKKCTTRTRRDWIWTNASLKVLKASESTSSTVGCRGWKWIMVMKWRRHCCFPFHGAQRDGRRLLGMERSRMCALYFLVWEIDWFVNVAWLHLQDAVAINAIRLNAKERYIYSSDSTEQTATRPLKMLIGATLQVLAFLIGMRNKRFYVVSIYCMGCFM